MGDNELKVVINGDPAQLKQAMSEAASSVQGAVSAMVSSFNGLNSTISSATSSIKGNLGMMGVAIAAALSVEGFRKAIDAAEEYAGSVRKLSTVLGLTAEAASELNVALKIVGLSADDYTGASMRLSRQIKTNEDGLNQLGVKTRNTAGEFLPMTEIMNNAISAMKEYKAGEDQIQFATDIMGMRGAESALKLMRLQEAMQRATPIMKELGLEMGQNAVDAAKRLQTETNVLGIVFDAFKVHAGTQLIPVLTELTKDLVSLAKDTLPLVSIGVKSLMTVFEAFKVVAVTVMNPIIGLFRVFSDLVTSNLKAAALAMQGDFTGAFRAMREGLTGAWEDFGAYGNGIVETSKKAYETVVKLWSTNPMEGGEKKPGGTKSYNAPDKGTDKSRMRQWEEELKAKEVAEKAYFGLSQAQEEAFWQSKLDLAKRGTAEYISVQAKLDELALKAGRESFENDQKNVRMESEAADKLAKDRIKDIDEEIALNNKATKDREKAIETKYQLGQIGADKEISQLRELENKRYQLEHEGLLREIEGLGEYEEEFVAVQRKILKAKQEHLSQMAELDNKAAMESKKAWDKWVDPVTTSISQSVQGIIQGTTTLRKAVANAAQSILLSFANSFAKIGMDWAKTQLQLFFATSEGESAKTAVIATATGERIALKAQETMSSIALSKTEAAATIPAWAGVAAAGAASAEASIPYVGPFLAAAAAAETFAMVMGYMAPAMAAAGGYDIPSGVNPVTQLHQEEMVLPASLANKVRSMTDGGGSPGRGMTLNVSAMDARDVTRALKNSRSPLSRVVKQMQRDGYFG